MGSSAVPAPRRCVGPAFVTFDHVPPEYVQVISGWVPEELYRHELPCLREFRRHEERPLQHVARGERITAAQILLSQIGERICGAPCGQPLWARVLPLECGYRALQ